MPKNKSKDKAVRELISGIRKRDSRSIGKVLSAIEDREELGQQCLEELFADGGTAYTIGITGPAGAGKSTLVDRLAVSYAEQGKRVAVIAVDPSSPFTRGALLGDRIRMDRAIAKDKVFIRSMASRGELGGLAPTTSEAIALLDAAGFEIIFVETVGVGQSEVEIIKNVDTVVVTLVPGQGDGVQALKAGILEIADVFAINKADYEGADRLRKELRGLLALAPGGKWEIPISETVATSGVGITELMGAIERHREYARNSGEIRTRKVRLYERATLRALSELLMDEIMTPQAKAHLEDLIVQIEARKITPFRAAQDLLDYAKKAQIR